MDRNELTHYQIKNIDKLVMIGCVVILLIIGFIINVTSVGNKIENITQKYFKSAKVQTYNKDYLIINASEYTTEEERLISLKKLYMELNKLDLETSTIYIAFYDKTWSNITKQSSIGLSELKNVDWSNKMTFEEFKKIVNYKEAP